MTNQDNNNEVKSLNGGFNFNKWLFNLEPNRTIKSLNAISKVIFVFTLLFLGAIIFKLFNIGGHTEHFRLAISGIDTLILYKTNFNNFAIAIAFEITRLLIIAITFFYFIKFLNSLDMADPFKDERSKFSIRLVAKLSILFFLVDFLGNLHISFFISNEPKTHFNFSNFNWGYFFLVYFINVFAIIFKRGVDLKNEIDLVI